MIIGDALHAGSIAGQIAMEAGGSAVDVCAATAACRAPASPADPDGVAGRGAAGRGAAGARVRGRQPEVQVAVASAERDGGREARRRLDRSERLAWRHLGSAPRRDDQGRGASGWRRARASARAKPSGKRARYTTAAAWAPGPSPRSASTRILAASALSTSELSG